MINLDNFGGCIGTLQNNPVILPNRDGSKKILMTVLCSDITKSNGHKTYQRIPVQGFIPKTYKGNGPYGYLHAGDEVHIEYSLKTTDHNGKTEVICQIDSIKFGKENTPIPEETPVQEPVIAQPVTPPVTEEKEEAATKYTPEEDLVNDDLDL